MGEGRPDHRPTAAENTRYSSSTPARAPTCRAPASSSWTVKSSKRVVVVLFTRRQLQRVLALPKLCPAIPRLIHCYRPFQPKSVKKEIAP